MVGWELLRHAQSGHQRSAAQQNMSHVHSKHTSPVVITTNTSACRLAWEILKAMRQLQPELVAYCSESTVLYYADSPPLSVWAALSCFAQVNQAMLGGGEGGGEGVQPRGCLACII